MPLDPNKLASLYQKKEKPKSTTTRAKTRQTYGAEYELQYPQRGPVRSIPHGGVTTRCCSRGCMTTAYWRVKGIPYCNIHAMYAMNQIALELDGDEDSEFFANAPGYPTPIDVMELLDILWEVYDTTQEAYDYIERIEKVMQLTFYPNLVRQKEVFNELRRQRERVGSTSNTT